MLRFASRLLAALLFLPSLAWAAVNINTADLAELETLPGIGASKAAAIVQYRADHGPFKSVDELDNVSGIGPSTMASLRDLVTVGAPGSAAPASPPPAASPAPAPSSAPPAPTPGAPAGCPVNINSADLAGLDVLPGIGASKAAAILQYRTDNGPFKSCDELDGVSGIGESTLAGLRDCCTVK